MLNGGLGNQFFQTSQAYSDGIKFAIYFDKKRNLTKEFKELYKCCIDVSKIPLLRTLFYKLWVETSDIDRKNILFLNFISGYSMTSSYINEEFSEKIKDCFNIKPRFNIPRSTVHLRLTDFVDLGRNTLSDKHSIPSLKFSGYLKTDSPDSDIAKVIMEKYNLKVEYRSAVEDWCDLIRSNEIICSDSTFSISAACISKELFNSTVYIPNNTEVAINRLDIKAYNDSFKELI